MSDHLGMGRLVLVARHRSRLRQEDLADRAGISRRVVVDIEAGRFDAVRVGDLAAVGAVLQLRLMLEWRAKRGDLHSLTDTGHAALVEAIVQLLAKAGWETRVEAVSASGAIDVLAFHPGARMLLMVEVKTRIVDVQKTLRELGYRRAVWRAAAEAQGWDARAVSTLLVVRDTSAQRRLIGRHQAIFASAFPLRGREARAWLDHPGKGANVLLFLSTVQGQHVIHADSVRVRLRKTERGWKSGDGAELSVGGPSGGAAPGTESQLDD